MKNPFAYFLIFLVASCNLAERKSSSDFDQAKIEIVYHLDYDIPSAKGSASATFNVKTKALITQLELNGKSGVSYNGHAMNPSTLPIVGGIYYDVNFKNYRNDNVFVYTDNNGKVYTNKFNVRPIAITDSLELPAEEGFEIHINRGPELEEKMWLYFSGDEFESGHVDVQTDDENANGYYDRTQGTIKITNAFMDKFYQSKNVEIYFHLNKYIKNLDQTPGKLGSIEITMEDKRVLHLK